jgi:hypothetical protein
MPKPTNSNVDEHALPQPNMTAKDLYWRCCCEHDNFRGEFQRCEKCKHFVAKGVPFHTVGGRQPRETKQ